MLNTNKHERLYSLFEFEVKEGKKIYRRISEFAYVKPSAVRIYQSALLAPFLGVDCLPRELRVVGHKL